MMAAHYRTRFKLDIVFFSASGKPYKSMPMGSAANNHTRIQDSKFQISKACIPTSQRSFLGS
jgi:hypothetical protein